MSADLVQEVAEALYDLEPLVTGYGDRERKLTWDEAQYEGYGRKYLSRAEAVIPIILDAAKEAIHDQKVKAAVYDLASVEVISAYEDVPAAIDSLRTTP